ncbi:penicillin-binding protein 1C [Chelatococcus sp. GCM10030263]|uniref:penicillin-binding protein 1C n=1 Tax=Chelatococcus sp. GCM10030263 TaxID=3273387 RepID=UPI003619A763
MTGRAIGRVAVIATATLVVAALIASAALWRFAAALGPLDLTVAEARSTEVLDRDGRLLRAFTTPEGRWRLPATIADVDPRFVALLKAYEDKRFDSHPGIDPLAALRAAGQLVTSGRIVSGASTLTMQVARLLEPRAERSLTAKLRQAVRAVELERRFSKDEILSLYLSLAPYGGNLEGIRAASLAYFAKEPKRLSLAEQALLVALPQSPETRRPDRFAEAARIARTRVLARAVEAGLISTAEAKAAEATPIPTARRPMPMVAPHAAEEAVAVDPGASVIRLAIDGRLQRSLEALARGNALRLGPNLSAAIVAIDNATGEIRAHVGAADYFAAERAGALDAALAVRSPGSALKPFIYALAFENGIAHPETVLDDRRTRFGAYAPENFDLAFQGTVTARRALQLSLNMPAVELLDALGPVRFLARLRNVGADIVLPKEDPGPPGLAIALGGLGIRLMDMARLYAGLARGGVVPTLVSRLDVKPVRAHVPPLTTPVAAWYVADVLRGAPPPVNALPRSIAFKTGTSYGYRDAWAVGFDRRTTIAVWLGRPDGVSVPGLVAHQVAAPVLFDAFARLDREPEAIPAPPNVIFATTATLPPPLRHLRPDQPKTIAATATAPLRIAYPPDGALVEVGMSGTASPSALPLKANGGVPPLTWLVNGAPVAEPSLRRESLWQPDSQGFAHVSVIDARGASDSVTVKVE